jgi:hypothetical protein
MLVDVKTVLEDPEIDPKLKAFGNLSIAILDALSAIAEDGVLPLAAGGGGGASGKECRYVRGRRNDGTSGPGKAAAAGWSPGAQGRP